MNGPSGDLQPVPSYRRFLPLPADVPLGALVRPAAATGFPSVPLCECVHALQCLTEQCVPVQKAMMCSQEVRLCRIQSL